MHTEEAEFHGSLRRCLPPNVDMLIVCTSVGLSWTGTFRSLHVCSMNLVTNTPSLV
jgi:hypothetical protein